MDNGSLAQLLSRGLEQQGLTADDVAERTKVPRSTLRALLGATEPAILPQRVYLRGHVGVIAKELGLDLDEVYARFDVENPVEARAESVEIPRRSRASVAAAAALGCIGILAVVLAFTH